MDFSDQLVEQNERFNIEDSEGANMLHDVQAQDKAQEDKRQDGKFVSAFESSDLNESGPSADEYDYNAEYSQGNSFKSGEDGGITLNNSNIKPFTKEIAGHDVVTGKRFTNEFSDYDGYIKEGVDQISNSKMNTVTGASVEDIVPLAKIANGLALNDKNYADFDETLGLSWSDQQKKLAWDGAQDTKLVIKDINNFDGEENRYTGVEDNDKIKLGKTVGIQEDIDESELVSNVDWLDSGRRVMDYFNPDSIEGPTDEQIHEYNLDLASEFNYNIPMMMFYAHEVIKSGDKDLAKSFLYILDQNDATDYSWSSFGRGGLNLLIDPTVYVTLGGGVLVSRAVGAGMKVGVKKALIKLATVTAAEAPLGAAEAAGADVTKQKVEIAAGEREEVDKGQAAAAGAVGAAVTTILGGTAAVVGDPVLRKFGIGAVRKGYKNLVETKPGPRAAQRGSVSVGLPSTQKQIEFRSQLEDTITRSFDGKKTISAKKLKNKIKGWLGEGKIKREEVDWSGINFLDDNDVVTKDQMQKYLSQNRSIPTVTDVVKTRFSENSLGNPEGGYREKIISIEGQGEYKGPIEHFGGVGIEGGAIVGHIRLTTSMSGGQKGTMLLEGQSDIRKTARYNTKTITREGKAVKESKDIITAKELAKEQQKIERRIDEIMSQKGGADLFDTELNDLLSKLDGIEDRVNLIHGSDEIFGEKGPGAVPFTPFRDKKSSNELMFRSAVMDAMNDGSEFLSWPKTAEQISEIQKWDDGGTGTRLSVIDQYQKDLPKIAKSYGFKVEEYVPDEFKEGTLKQSYIDSIVFDKFDDWLGEIGLSYVEEGVGIKLVNQEGGIYKSFHTADEFDRWSVEKFYRPIGNKFFRIVFDEEVKAKWRKEGAAMYSFGAPAIITGHTATRQDRDKNGKFK